MHNLYVFNRRPAGNIQKYYQHYLSGRLLNDFFKI